MGEAKRNKSARMTATRRQLEIHPFCIYCGGEKRATTVDHQPPKILFLRKHRPRGLEFSACAICNRVSSGDDAVFGLIGRLCGSRKPEFALPDSSFRDVISTVESAFPGLPGQLIGGQSWKAINGVQQLVSYFRFDNPTLAQSLCRTAAKLALSVFYEEMKRPVSGGAFVSTYWTHNQREGNEKVQQLISALPKSVALKQGEKWDTQDIFFARYISDATGFTVVIVAYGSLALFASIIERDKDSRVMDWQYTWRVEQGVGIRPASAGRALI